MENTNHLLNKIVSLEKENEDLKDKLLDLTFEVNNSKEKELLDFVRSLKEGVENELKDKNSELTKEDLLKNIQQNLKSLAKEYRIMI